MKNMKALLISLVLSFSVATAITAVGCKNDVESSSGGNNSASSNWFTGEEESSVSVKFSLSQVEVYQYESAALVCTVKGSNEAVTYSSSDEAIASVDANGVVTAKDKVGSVTVTATVEGVSATCKVNIAQSPYYPAIALDTKDYTVENGETLTFAVSTEWNKTAIDEAIEYQVSFAEDSKDAAAQISVDGDKVSVATNGVESFKFIVSATVRGIYTSEQISVNVVAPQIKLQPTNLAFKPQSNGYKATISTTDLVGNMVNSLPLEFVAVQGAETFENVDIEWTLSGTSVKVEEGSIIGQGKGEATLTGTATVEGETVTVTVTCNVVAPEVRLDRTEMLEVAEITNKSISFTDGELIGKLENAEFHGVQVSSRVTLGKNILFSADNFPKTASKLGRQELVINTSLVRYVMDVDVYTRIINTADEFDLMLTESNTGETEWSNRFEAEKNSQLFDGYYVLGNDISYNKTIKGMTDTGTVWGVQGTTTDHHRGFKGVFDGCGYNIDGVTVGKNPSGSAKEAGGIFGFIGTGGIVRNVSFTNAVLNTNQGFICAMGDGTIENVSISYKQIGDGQEVLRTVGSFFSYGAGSHATVRNCLIDASAANINLEIVKTNGELTNNIALMGKATNVENVIVLCPDANVLKTSGADVTKKSYLDLIAEPNLFANFDSSIWTTVEGIPMFVNQADNLDTTTPIEFLNVDPSIVVGFEMVIRATNPYVKFEVAGEVVNGALVEGAVEGVTLADSLLTAKEIAFKKTVRLKTTSLLNPELTATCDVYIDSFGSVMKTPDMEETPAIDCFNPVLNIGDNSWIGDAEQVYVYYGKDVIGSGKETITLNAWQSLEWGENEVTVVLVKNLGEANENRENFATTVSLTYSKGKLADSELIVENGFGSWRGYAPNYEFVDVATDMAAPEGFEKVNRLDSYTQWASAMGSTYFTSADLSGYQDIWFAIKAENITRYIFQTVEVQTSGWIYFHYTQTSDGVWAAEVKVDGEVYKTEYNINNYNSKTGAQSLQDILYRNGWSNGFLIYNNSRDADAVSETKPTSVYITEIRGIAKN